MGEADTSASGSRSKIRDIIRGFVRGDGDSGRKNRESNDVSNQELTAGSAAEANVSSWTCFHCHDSRAGMEEGLD